MIYLTDTGAENRFKVINEYICIKVIIPITAVSISTIAIQ